MLETGSTLGSYELRAELGSGAMGTVYLAGDPEGGRYAIKVLPPHLLEQPGFLARFVREAEVGRTVHHPNVVRVLDRDAVDVDGKTYHFLVMQYVEGRPLRRLADELGALPESLLREVALQCASGLAAIHAQGIVHRDLKPENIMVTREDEVRIMDLGLAKLQEASLAITLAGHFAGSMLYAAPEQFVNEALGPAADLYALGVTLYELAAGENPFGRESAAGVIDAHLYYEPPRLAQATPLFAELVAKLMAKRPESRFSSARELHGVLTAGTESAWWVALEPELRRRGARPRIPVARAAGLHGRADALATLDRAWRDACAGFGNVVMVEGEAGIGKTRLVDAFVDALEDERAHVLYGAYPPEGGLGGVSDAVIEKFGTVRLADALQSYLRVTPTLVPAFAALVKHEDPPPGSPPLSTSGLRAVSTHLMRALADERAVLWVIDDLHHAPKESRDLALALARAVAGRRVLLLLTARPGLDVDELARFERLPHFARLPLRRLDGRETAALLREVASLPDATCRKIARRTGGVPLFALETARAFVREPGAVEGSGARDLVEERLGTLSQAQRRTLDVGAVEGFFFDPSLVAYVLGIERVRVLQDIATIEKRTGLVHLVADRARFDQEHVRDALYDAMRASVREGYHTQLAEAYARRLDGPATGPHAVFLASHHVLGFRPERAAPHISPALAHMQGAHRNEALIQLARRVLSCKGLLEAEDRISVLLRLARCLGRLGRRDQERGVLREAVTAADDADERRLRAQARLALGGHLLQTSRYDTAAEVAGRALEFARAIEAPRLEARAEGELGRVFLHLSRYGEALSHFERQLHLVRDLADARGEAGALCDLGVVLKSLGRYEQARVHFERALRLAREMGDASLEASATGGLGTVAKAMGGFEAARSRFEQQCELARAAGDRFSEATGLGNLGLVFKNLGRYEEARRCFDEGLAISREIDYRLGESIGLVHLGLVLKSLGRYNEAATHFRQGRDLARELGDRHGEAVANGNLGNVAFDRGEFADAQRYFERWRETANELGDRQGEASATGNLGNVLVARGRYAAAHRHFERARTISGELGDRTGEAMALSEIGALAAACGDPARGRTLLDRALAMLRDVGERRAESYALHVLGDIEAQEGRPAEALARYREALGIRKEIGFPLGEAETTLAMARLHADPKSLADAQTMVDLPAVRIPALCRLAALDPARAEDAERAYAAEEQRLAVPARIDARFRLWRATGTGRHLSEARRLLHELRAHAAEADREALVENVPLHAEISAAAGGIR